MVRFTDGWAARDEREEESGKNTWFESEGDGTNNTGEGEIRKGVPEEESRLIDFWMFM